MQNSNHSKCSTRELKILGDFWTLQIIQALVDGKKRFSQIERELSGVNPTTLTNRLKKLEKQQIVMREKGEKDKLCVYYELTQKGKGILPILSEIKRFAERYL